MVLSFLLCAHLRLCVKPKKFPLFEDKQPRHIKIFLFLHLIIPKLQAMKKYFLSVLILCITATAFAQKPPNAAQLEALMKKAQKQLEDAKRNHPEAEKAMQEYKRKMPQIQYSLDTLKAKYPGMKMPELPDIDKLVKSPDFDKIIAQQKEQEQKLQKLKTTITVSNRQGLPEPSSRVINEQAIDTAKIRSWAGIIKSKAAIALGSVITTELDETYADTSLNPAAVGMLLIATGLPKYTGQYLVCRTLTDHPGNAMAINDLGIFYRFEKDYDRAIQCFLLAQRLNDSCTEIKANLGWAYAYAGNFLKAKSYFNGILAKKPDYGTAIEGLSLIAYKEGDLQTFWNNLAKQMLTANRTGGYSGTPSGQMASFCAGVMTEDEINRMGRKAGDRAMNNSFNNPGPADPGVQSDEPSLETPNDIDYTAFIPDFPADAKRYSAGVSNANISKYYKEIESYKDNVKSLGKRLPIPKQFINEDGELETVTDWGNDPHYKFFHQVHEEYNRRTSKIIGEYGDQLASSGQSFAATFNGVFTAFTDAMKSCGEDDQCKYDTAECPCIKKVKCNYMPKLSGAISSYVMSVGDITATAISKLDNESAWYRDASSPMIQFIPEKDWNNYMNAIREADIRTAKLLIMAHAQHTAATYESYIATAKALSVQDECIFELNLPAPDFKTPGVKKLKTFPEPCKAPPGAGSLGPIHYIDDCNHTRIGITVAKNKYNYTSGPAKASAEADVSLFFEKIKNKQFTEGDYYRGGMELHAKAEYNYADKNSNKFGLIDAKASAGFHAKGEITIDAFQAWDANGRPMKKGFSLDASGSVSGEANVSAGIGKQNTDLIKNSFDKGFHVNGEFSAVYGADGQLGNYNFRDMAGSSTGK